MKEDNGTMGHRSYVRAGIILAFIPTVAMCAAAWAQDSGLRNSFLACGDIPDRDARLDCFDRALASIRQAAPAAPAASGSYPVVAAPAPDVQKTEAETAVPPEDFGLARSRKQKEREKMENRITATLIRMSRSPDGKILFHLDNGQVWVEKRSTVNHIPPGEHKVTIETALLSGFEMRIDDLTGIVRVRRLK